ncbi:hypothetical protein LWI28_014878 [Acer negundo]|uniref:Uncharacterized protein n=1 Tax=Acer negundo TaxID=4023 RepID=A0AAD5IZR7_ACENE|nr:hypothetical protein LWI28_014878 [Acer negundo]
MGQERLGLRKNDMTSRKDDKSFELRKMKLALGSIFSKLGKTSSCNSRLDMKGHVMKVRNPKSILRYLGILKRRFQIIRIGVALGLDFVGKLVGMTEVFVEAKRKLKLGGFRELEVH